MHDGICLLSNMLSYISCLTQGALHVTKLAQCMTGCLVTIIYILNYKLQEADMSQTCAKDDGICLLSSMLFLAALLTSPTCYQTCAMDDGIC